MNGLIDKYRASLSKTLLFFFILQFSHFLYIFVARLIIQLLFYIDLFFIYFLLSFHSNFRNHKMLFICLEVRQYCTKMRQHNKSSLLQFCIECYIISNICFMCFIYEAFKHFPISSHLMCVYLYINYYLNLIIVTLKCDLVL